MHGTRCGPGFASGFGVPDPLGVQVAALTYVPTRLPLAYGWRGP